MNNFIIISWCSPIAQWQQLLTESQDCKVTWSLQIEPKHFQGGKDRGLGLLSRSPFDVGEAEKLFPEGLSVWVLRVQVAVVIVLLQFLKMSAAEGYVIGPWGRKGDFSTIRSALCLAFPHLEVLLSPVVIQHHLFVLFLCEQGLSCRCPLSFLKQMTGIVCVRKKERRKRKENHECY